MQFSDCHIYDCIKTTNDHKLHNEIDLICDNERKKMKRISLILNMFKTCCDKGQISNACKNTPLTKKLHYIEVGKQRQKQVEGNNKTTLIVSTYYIWICH